MGWEENEFGLLVPDSPYRYGSTPVGLKRLRSLLGKKYLFAKPRRQLTPGVQSPPSAKGLDLNTLQAHVQGRNEEALRVLVGVAVLRSLDLLPRGKRRLQGRRLPTWLGLAPLRRRSPLSLYSQPQRLELSPLRQGPWPSGSSARTSSRTDGLSAQTRELCGSPI